MHAFAFLATVFVPFTSHRAFNLPISGPTFPGAEGGGRGRGGQGRVSLFQLVEGGRWAWWGVLCTFVWICMQRFLFACLFLWMGWIGLGWVDFTTRKAMCFYSVVFLSVFGWMGWMDGMAGRMVWIWMGAGGWDGLARAGG
ncbi:hypothetical protein BZA05DRAFT_397851 [Tricharina praecox]|uniref:uncharacterized protein n=1 Tax=Tricharina praecox TaxID=43433 RepID=UPI002220937A|nr:uncharacterized protein BZA05DRAFT_397851 [Tricharina praecox]KAI5851800.1 hypothetical protein BZA05DRAFT_397851 [Tricharina praecox]